jgi:hypothetical protein
LDTCCGASCRKALVGLLAREGILTFYTPKKTKELKKASGRAPEANSQTKLLTRRPTNNQARGRALRERERERDR